jgi:hypothetical protein
MPDDFRTIHGALENAVSKSCSIRHRGFLPSYTTSGLGHGESDPDKALKYIDQIKPKFIVNVREDLQSAPDFVNLVNLPLLADLGADLDSRGKRNSDPFLVSGFSGFERSAFSKFKGSRPNLSA